MSELQVMIGVHSFSLIARYLVLKIDTCQTKITSG